VEQTPEVVDLRALADPLDLVVEQGLDWEDQDWEDLSDSISHISILPCQSLI
jgi:hypothetical protein